MAFGSGNRRFTTFNQSGVLESNIDSSGQQTVCGDIDQVPFVLMSRAVFRTQIGPRKGFCVTTCDDINLPSGGTIVS